MPTERPRYMLTGTDEIAAALGRAAQRWPQDGARPTRLLQRLIAAGDAALSGDDARQVQARREAIAAAGGAMTGVYPLGYLDDLREDWPE